MRKANPRRDDVAGPSGPAAYGRPRVPTVPIPIPVLAAAALMAAFTLGRASAKMRRFAGGPCRAASWGLAEPPRGATGCGPRRKEERPSDGEKTVGA